MIAAGPADHTLVGPDLDLDEGGFVDAVRERSLPATRIRARFLRRVVLFQALLEPGLPANGRSRRAGRGRISRAKTVVSVDGEVTSGLLGVDYEKGPLLGGVAPSRARGGLRSGDGRSEMEATLTSVHPYLRYAVSERLSVWRVLGLDRGGDDARREGDGQEDRSLADVAGDSRPTRSPVLTGQHPFSQAARRLATGCVPLAPRRPDGARGAWPGCGGDSAFGDSDPGPRALGLGRTHAGGRGRHRNRDPAALPRALRRRRGGADDREGGKGDARGVREDRAGGRRGLARLHRPWGFAFARQRLGKGTMLVAAPAGSVRILR